MILWVVGAGGLLGSAINRAAQESGWKIFTASSVPWQDSELAVSVISADAQRFADELKSAQQWAIVWAAGQATTASTADESAIELSVFTQCVTAIRDRLDPDRPGTFLLASSAGGIYAGCDNPPFDARTPPNPVGVYGHLKREQEIAAEALLSGSFRVVVARIANLYGPGQNLNKLQGLISRLALTAITKNTLTMFVPLDTLRDYIHVDDAAKRVLDWLGSSSPGYEVRVIASGFATSLGYIINQMKDVTRTRIPVAYGLHPSAAYQARDLRLIPDCSPSVTHIISRSLPEGMKDVYADVLLRYQEGLSH